MHGADPDFLRRVREPAGWRQRGHGANHPEATPPVGWSEVGLCWAQVDHAVVDVTYGLRLAGRAPGAGRAGQRVNRPPGPPARDAAGYLGWGELRSAAMAFAGHGWPVLRGTYLAHIDGGPSRWCGRQDAVGLRPVDDDWAVACTLQADEVARWWSAAPYSVIVVCGRGADCIELPSRAWPGLLTALHAAGCRPPAMLTPVGTLVLFVRTYTGPRPVLVAASLRSVDSWVAVPPTTAGHDARGSSRYRWLPDCCPEEGGWWLPELAQVYEVITPILRAKPPRRVDTNAPEDTR